MADNSSANEKESTPRITGAASKSKKGTDPTASPETPKPRCPLHAIRHVFCDKLSPCSNCRLRNDECFVSTNDLSQTTVPTDKKDMGGQRWRRYQQRGHRQGGHHRGGTWTRRTIIRGTTTQTHREVMTNHGAMRLLRPRDRHALEILMTTRPRFVCKEMANQRSKIHATEEELIQLEEELEMARSHRRKIRAANATRLDQSESTHDSGMAEGSPSSPGDKALPKANLSVREARRRCEEVDNLLRTERNKMAPLNGQLDSILYALGLSPGEEQGLRRDQVSGKNTGRRLPDEGLALEPHLLTAAAWKPFSLFKASDKVECGSGTGIDIVFKISDTMQLL
ncbi:hypothetical protein NM208_g5499 [Fusarium decemcellulare]|uniref:Uncharacterized protein n=1 Tax=Fusarium decemcellulare TaxID=57161 RepID=A0ACC1SH33_9HYPO|nr:hypothetical protein NM208_g5499 [Fusarium decemcellulare]